LLGCCPIVEGFERTYPQTNHETRHRMQVARSPSHVEGTVHVVDSQRRRLSVDNLIELWNYREVFLAFAVRHFKIRYKQAAIGVGWSLVQPVFAAILFAIFLGRFAHLSGEGRPYFLFALAGLVLWTFFSTAVTSSADSLVRDSNMVRKVYFPREILPLSAVAAALADLPAAVLVLLGANLASGGTPALTWLLIPLPIFLVLLNAASLGLILSALNVYYRDVRHALPFLLQVIMFSSPVIYSLSIIPDKWRAFYLAVNPMATAIEDLRRLVLHNAWPDLWTNVWALSSLIVLLVAAYYFFLSLQRDFADHL
jgi:lipopolysaccharide transport system permease protein